jgi:hypothetical protein
MPDTLSVDLKASLAWLLSESLSLSTVSDNASLEYSKSLADGTGADLADLLWHAERTVGAGSNDDLDLTALTKTIFGTAVVVNFTKVKAILVINTSSTSGQELRIGGAGGGVAFSAPFNGDADAQIEVGADSCLLLSNKKDGWTVTPGTGDVLRIANPNAAAVTYKIAIIGTSA